MKFKKVSEIITDNTILKVCSSDTKSVKVFSWQVKGDFEANDECGAVLKTEEFLNKSLDFIKKSKELCAELVLTPEYSFPHDIIDKIVKDKNLWPEKGCLWCLGSQGENKAKLKDRMEEWSKEQDTLIVDYAYKSLSTNIFVSPILYLFRTNDEKLCVIPQFKVSHMKDPWHDFEAEGLSTGSVIYVFDLNENKKCRNSFLSVICADVFKIKPEDILNDDNIAEENVLIFHPQLNPNPRHVDFRSFRNGLLSNNGKKVKIMTLNWAKDTKTIVNGKTARFDMPFSAIYLKTRYKANDPDHRKLRGKNFKKGLYFAYNRESKIDIWYSHQWENCNLLYINKEFFDGTITAADLEEPIAKESYSYDEESKQWKTEPLPCKYDLNTILKSNGVEYDFPLEICKQNPPGSCLHKECKLDVCDFFFSLCFGEKEEMELTTRNELVNRIVMGSDNESNEKRKHKATHYNQLVNQLRVNNFPISFSHFSDNHKMEVFANYPDVGMENYNLVQKELSPENVDLKALVTITKDKHSESEIQTLIDQLSLRMSERYRNQVLVYYEPDDGGPITFYDKNLEQNKLDKGEFTANKASIYNSKY